MIDIDAPTLVREWFSSRRPGWVATGVDAKLRVPDDEVTNKAGVRLETASHVASITVWGNGMLEFIILDVRTQMEEISEDKQVDSAAQLRALLDGCATAFFALAQAKS